MTKSFLLSERAREVLILVRTITAPYLRACGDVSYWKTGCPQSEAIGGVEVPNLLNPDNGDKILASNVSPHMRGAVIPVATYFLRRVRHEVRLAVVIV